MSMLLRALCLAALIGAPIVAQAAGPAGAERAVQTLARSTVRLVHTRHADKTLSAYAGGQLSLAVRPAAGVIELTAGSNRIGFFVDQRGQLPATEAARLTRALRAEPRATSDAILRTLLRSTNELEREERRLATKLPLITTLLTKASSSQGHQDREIWRGERGSLIYRPMANVLVGSGRFSETGFFLARTARGLEVQAGDLEGLQRFLLESE